VELRPREFEISYKGTEGILGVEEAHDTVIAGIPRRRYKGEFYPKLHGLCVFSLQFNTRFNCKNVTVGRVNTARLLHMCGTHG
jgi:hypothetical protein